MNFLAYQILIFVIGTVFLAKAFSHYWRNEQTIRELIAIILFWLCIFAVTVNPEILAGAAQLLGFKEYINGIFVAAFIVLFYVSFKLILKSDKQEKEITQVVRKLALDEYKYRSDKKNKR